MSCEGCPSKGNCSKSEGSCGIVNNPNNHIRHIVGVMSGKGGVGKSSISVLLARQLARKGLKVGIMDADITGPSIPRLLGMPRAQAFGTNDAIEPVVDKDGIKCMSLNFLMDDENQPVVWRGPIVANAVKQFYTDVIWGDLDVLFIDMPPGTGDVALTVLQSIPVNGVVMVSTPQPMVSMIVSKAVNMCRQLKIPVLGVVENMSYISCPNCGEKIALCQDSDRDEFLKQNELKLYGELPMTQSLMNINQEETFDARTLIEIEQLMEPAVKQLREDLGI